MEMSEPGYAAFPVTPPAPIAGLARLAALLLAALAACASPAPKLGPMRGTVPVPPVSHEPYRIQAGDELEIRFFHTPDQNVTLPVRPDGLISLPLVHEIEVEGRTEEEVRRDLVDRCSEQLANPGSTAVIIRAHLQRLPRPHRRRGGAGHARAVRPRTVLEGGVRGRWPPVERQPLVRPGRAPPRRRLYRLLAADLTAC
jgi:hypothetical protein